MKRRCRCTGGSSCSWRAELWRYKTWHLILALVYTLSLNSSSARHTAGDAAELSSGQSGSSDESESGGAHFDDKLGPRKQREGEYGLREQMTLSRRRWDHVPYINNNYMQTPSHARDLARQVLARDANAASRSESQLVEEEM
jgi:hypothetical protein